MRRSNGFTLMEVIIALTILFVGILGAMQFVPAALRNSRRAVERETAARTVQADVSMLRAEGAESLFRRPEGLGERLMARLGLDPLGQAIAADDIYRQTSPSTLFSGYRGTVSQLVGAQEVYLQRVTMRVKMADGRYEEFVTYVTRE